MIMAQDTNPMVWGAMDKFQAHFVVNLGKDSDSPALTARTVVSTKGRFGAKQVTGVRWSGSGTLAQALDSDSALNEMIAKRSVREADIFVEPTDSGVRIHSTWRASDELGITKDEFEIYDRIAGHIKAA